MPDLEHNADATNAESENLYIVGDKLDALKHLLGSYAARSNASTSIRRTTQHRGHGYVDEILEYITRFHIGDGARRITATTDAVNTPMAAAFDPGRLQAWSRCAST